MRRVILDANFLMLAPQYRLDIWGELGRVLEEPFEVFLPRMR